MTKEEEKEFWKLTKKERAEKVSLHNARGYYYLQHGHWPEDEKAKQTCNLCHKEWQKMWNGIALTQDHFKKK